MKSWKVLIWALVSAGFFVVTVAVGFWLLATTVTTGTTVVVNGVTVAEEGRTDYTQLVVPILFLGMGLLGFTAAGSALWRAVRSSD